MGTAKAYYNDRLTEPSLRWAGLTEATLVNSGIDFVGGLLQLARTLGHLDKRTEFFRDHPRRSTLPGLVRDVAAGGVAAGVIRPAGVGAAPGSLAADADDDYRAAGPPAAVRQCAGAAVLFAE